MTFTEEMLQQARPDRLGDFELPRRALYHPSPVDWRDEVLYFVLTDRFSDGREESRPLLNRTALNAARPTGWRWDQWAESGANRWQGGTIRGVKSKLAYLRDLGVTTLWLSPVFKQRGHENSYHGYGVQDFLDVDPRFGERRDLVDLVRDAHEMGLRVILDVIFNHSGPNWLYSERSPGGRVTPDYTERRHAFGSWRGADGTGVPAIISGEDGVWPDELQDPEHYTRAGRGSLGAGRLDDPFAEHKRTDFEVLRDFNLRDASVLSDLAACYKYWIALTDCDGFRIDTLKHVSFEEARNFCGTIKEFAANLGKANFLLVGEIAGGDDAQDRYLDVLGRNLDAALDIGHMRLSLNLVAKGLSHPGVYFDGFDAGDAEMGSHRNLGNKHISILDDHDHVFGDKVRFSAEATSERQVVTGVSIQLLTLGIPCVYYGTEQALGGPEAAERRWLPDWKRSDRYLREAMFGPDHPRLSGLAGLRDGVSNLDPDLPGFGAFGTAGHHVFDATYPTYRCIAAVADIRRRFPSLRQGRQYLRPFRLPGRPFGNHGLGEIVAWSRILDDEEALCIVNAHGEARRGGDVIVDDSLNRGADIELTVVANTVETAEGAGFSGRHAVGSTVPVRRDADGRAFVEIRNLAPSAVLVLTNRP